MVPVPGGITRLVLTLSQALDLSESLISCFTPVREINDSDKAKAWLKVKTSRVMPPGTGTMHIILAVTDLGSPRLTRYQRVIVSVEP